jgi:hypothetical protein
MNIDVFNAHLSVHQHDIVHLLISGSELER